MNAAHLDPLPSDLPHLASAASTAHATNINNVDEIIARLELARSQLLSLSSTGEGGDPSGGTKSGAFADTLLPLSSFVKTANSKAAAAAKDWGAAVGKFGKGVEKRFGPPPPPLFPPPTAPPSDPSFHSTYPSPASTPSAPPSSPQPFSSSSAQSALHASIATHLARIGAFSSLTAFLAESGIAPPAGIEEGGTTRARLIELHALLSQLEQGEARPALDWLEAQQGEGNSVDEHGELEYALRKEEYIRLLLSSPVSTAEDDNAMVVDGDDLNAKPAATNISDPIRSRAMQYGGAHFRRMLTPTRSDEICALLTSPLYLPLPRLLASPYSPLFTPYKSSPCPATAAVATAFAAAYLQTMGLPPDSPLSVVTDVGGSGALAKILKVRQVMKEKKTEWSARGELPVEIPLPPRYKYHSVFACPVSKEQSTSQNPPMLLPCGHVIARESLGRLARGTPTLKCPYCPVVSHFSACVRVHF
ncbi:hypothetical protein JCM11641_000406 [Rhodosporidiobolus odoratus]